MNTPPGRQCFPGNIDNSTRHPGGKRACQAYQNIRILQAVEEPLGDGGQPGLYPDQGSGEDCTRLVLSPAVDGVEDGGFEIVGKSGGKIE